MYARSFGRTKVILVGQSLIFFRTLLKWRGSAWVCRDATCIIVLTEHLLIDVSCDVTWKPYSSRHCTVCSWLVSSDYQRLHDQDLDRDQLGEAKIPNSRVWVFLRHHIVLSLNHYSATVYNLCDIVKHNAGMLNGSRTRLRWRRRTRARWSRIIATPIAGHDRAVNCVP